MPETILFLMMMFFLLSIGLSIGLTSFAFSDPKAFAEWFPISSWLCKIWDPRFRYAHYWSYGIGSLTLALMLALSFIFGSLTITFSLGVWTSPILQWLEPK